MPDGFRIGMIVEWLIKPLLIIAPAVVGGVLHSIAIKLRILQWLARPISERWFGRHKTYRGFVLMPLGCIVGVYVAMLIERQLPSKYAVGFDDLRIWLEGALLGIAYMLFELPNSFVKRRLGVKEGALANGAARWPFIVADQLDSAVGCLLVCWMFLDVGVAVLAATVVLGAGVHVVTSRALYLAGIRSRPI